MGQTVVQSRLGIDIGAKHQEPHVDSSHRRRRVYGLQCGQRLLERGDRVVVDNPNYYYDVS